MSTTVVKEKLNKKNCRRVAKRLELELASNYCLYTKETDQQTKEDAASHNLKVLDKATTAIQGDAASIAGRIAKDAATAEARFVAYLDDDDFDEVANMAFPEKWQWLTTYGRDNQVLSAPLQEERLRKILKKDRESMSQYLDDIKRAHRDLSNLDPSVMPMTAFFGVVLKNIGKERRGTGPYRRVYETLLEMNRMPDVNGIKVLTWKTLRSRLELAEEDLSSSSDEDSGDDAVQEKGKLPGAALDEANITTAIVEALKTLKGDIAMLTAAHQQSRCFECGKPGHHARDCYSRHGNSKPGYNARVNNRRQQGPERWDRRRDKQQDRRQRQDRQQDRRPTKRNSRGADFSETEDEGEIYVCIDGASTTHLTRSAFLRRSMRNVRQDKGDIILMNSFPVRVRARGDLHVYINDIKIILYNVAYVPESRHDLLSVSRLLHDHGGVVSHTENGVKYTSPEGALIEGHKKDGLYFFKIDEVEPPELPSRNDTAMATIDLPLFRRGKAWAIDFMSKLHARLHDMQSCNQAGPTRDETHERPG